MFVEVENCTLLNVWEESFKDRETGEDVKFWRALVNVPGEAPAQLAVLKDEYESLRGSIGTVGVAVVQIDAQPGRRARVNLRGIQ